MNSGITGEEIKRLFNYLEESKTNNDLQIIMTTEGCHDLYKLFIDFNNYQKILEEKNKTFEDYNKDLNNQLDKLEEENRILKELNVCVGCNNNLDYKSRIDKAIKLLEEDYFEDGSGNNVEEVIKILKGEENE